MQPTSSPEPTASFDCNRREDNRSVRRFSPVIFICLLNLCDSLWQKIEAYRLLCITAYLLHRIVPIRSSNLHDITAAASDCLKDNAPKSHKPTS